jgi:hypothetical protein
LGKAENSFGRLSQVWEKQKMASGDFPKVGKNRKWLQVAFLRLGKMENCLGLGYLLF